MNKNSDKILQQVRQVHVDLPVDSMLYLCPGNNGLNCGPNHAKYRYVVFCDSSMCSLCALQRMGVWNGIMERAHEIEKDVEFYFIFNTCERDTHAFIDGYRLMKFNLGVWVDSTGTMLRNNPILSNYVLHAFIMDRNNNIVKIGDSGKDKDVEREFYNFLLRNKGNNDDGNEPKVNG